MDNDYAEPLLAAQRALRRASDLAAERRYVEAAAHLTAARAAVSEAEKRVRRTGDQDG